MSTEAVAIVEVTRTEWSALRLLSPSEFMARPIKPIEWVLEPIASSGHLTYLHGDAGVGKSWTALVAAAQRSLLDQSQEVWPVLYVDAENFEDELRNRFECLPTIAHPHTAFVCKDLREHVGEVEAAIDQTQARLVIFDSFRTIWRGDENSDLETTEFLDRIRHVLRRTGAAGIMLGHDRKDGDVFRGSSAIKATVEHMWRLETVSSERRRLTPEKQRGVRTSEPIDIVFCIDDGTATVRRAASPVPTNVRRGGPSPRGDRRVTSTDLQAAINEFVEEQPGSSINRIKGSVPGNSDRIKLAVLEMIAAGSLVDRGPAGGPSRIYIADPDPDPDDSPKGEVGSGRVGSTPNS